jgi:hypothetical protein
VDWAKEVKHQVVDWADLARAVKWADWVKGLVDLVEWVDLVREGNHLVDMEPNQVVVLPLMQTRAVKPSKWLK